MSVEQNPNITEMKVKWENPDIAMDKLLLREVQVLDEANTFWLWEVQCTEFCHRNEKNICNFMSKNFPDLDELILSV